MHSSSSKRTQTLSKTKYIHGLESEFSSEVEEFLVCLGYRLQDDAVSGSKVIQNRDKKTVMDGDTETTGEKAAVGYLKAAIPLNTAKSHERR